MKTKFTSCVKTEVYFGVLLVMSHHDVFECIWYVIYYLLKYSFSVHWGKRGVVCFYQWSISSFNTSKLEIKPGNTHFFMLPLCVLEAACKTAINNTVQIEYSDIFLYQTHFEMHYFCALWAIKKEIKRLLWTCCSLQNPAIRD